MRREEYLSFAQENGLLLYETSACSGQNVQDAFHGIAENILNHHRQDLAVIKTEQRDKIVLLDKPLAEIDRDKKRGCSC